jgi:hypothetical protein
MSAKKADRFRFSIFVGGGTRIPLAYSAGGSRRDDHIVQVSEAVPSSSHTRSLIPLQENLQNFLGAMFMWLAGSEGGDLVLRTEETYEALEENLFQTNTVVVCQGFFVAFECNICRQDVCF